VQMIHPYKLQQGGWVFDDPDKGLVEEGLVSGIDTLLDRICDEFGLDPEDGFDVVFSSEPIEGPVAVLRKREEIDGRPDLFGTNYLDEMSGIQGWLCPNLLQYFDLPPEVIYCRVVQL
jgi:hypothetical protein